MFMKSNDLFTNLGLTDDNSNLIQKAIYGVQKYPTHFFKGDNLYKT